MKLAALVSGGKDSIYALYKAQQEHEVKVIIAIKSENPDSYMFHRPNIDLVKLQANALDLPIIFKKTPGEKEKELEDLKKAIIEAKEKYKIDGLVSGALASNYQKSRIERICKEINLKSITPIWHVNPREYMIDLLSKFKVITVKVACDGLKKDSLGKEINLEKIEKLSSKYRFHIAFEGGEAETLVLDAPNFNKKINILDSKTRWDKESQSGEFIIKRAHLEIKKK
ncbi:MAG: diphthine--ammonia ligase [Candidatus Woesearchaeota archaeon]|nr:MAG: diphthine--ammonia ligase [Candidatus Woesearchaeota archaeon]